MASLAHEARESALSPADVLRLEPEEADELLDRLESSVPAHPGLLHLASGRSREAVVFGDSHGDWRSTVAVAQHFLEAPAQRLLIGLGDYVDRAPSDCAEGSVANALYLLALAAAFPDRVFLLQGNHETSKRIPVLPHDLPEEVDGLWGPMVERYARIQGLLERGPYAALSENGAYLAHAGFPRVPEGGPLSKVFDNPSEEVLFDVVWADCAAARGHHVGGTQFTEVDFERFLAWSGARVFLRGHDPDLTGRPVFHDRVLTLHTSRVYERFGGVVFARLPLDRPIGSIADLKVEQTGTAGMVYPEP
ncbi:MAG: metallophosphoesterase [Thermoplasmata archaeon]|nr:metallophosphoesterase [Thermoplasmata archaeon]